MNETKWYKIQKKKDKTIILEYNINNRIIAIYSLFILLSIYFLYSIFINSEISIYVKSGVGTISLYLLVMSLIIDSYILNTNKNKIFCKKGLFPFYKKSTIDFNQIENFKYDMIELTYRKKKLYSFYVILKNEKKIKFGNFKQNEILLDFLKWIPRKSL